MANTFGSAPNPYNAENENQFRQAVSTAFTAMTQFVNTQIAAAVAAVTAAYTAAIAAATTTIENWVTTNFLPIGGSAHGTAQALTAGTDLSMTPAGTFDGSVARTLAVTGAPWAGITGLPTTLAGYGITDAAAGTAGVATQAAEADKLTTARTINGVSFDGTANIIVTVSTLAWSDITSTPSTLAGYGITDAAAGSGGVATEAAEADKLTTARAINGVNFDGTAPITVAAAAGTLTGSTLAAGVTASSLTSVGTLSTLSVSGATTLNGNALIWPAGTGTLNEVLTTDGAGNLSWAAGGGGSSSPAFAFFVA